MDIVNIVRFECAALLLIAGCTLLHAVWCVEQHRKILLQLFDLDHDKQDIPTLELFVQNGSELMLRCTLIVYGVLTIFSVTTSLAYSFLPNQYHVSGGITNEGVRFIFSMMLGLLFLLTIPVYTKQIDWFREHTGLQQALMKSAHQNALRFYALLMTLQFGGSISLFII